MSIFEMAVSKPFILSKNILLLQTTQFVIYSEVKFKQDM